MTRTDDATQPPLPEDAPRGPALPGLEQALRAPDASVRLRVALEAGTRPAPGDVLPLLRRCEEEPDFFVREMLTWALTRHPTDVTVPLLLAQLTSPVPQARSQSLHTLSKLGDARAWPMITDALLTDADDEVARTAWRTAAGLVPRRGAGRPRATPREPTGARRPGAVAEPGPGVPATGGRRGARAEPAPARWGTLRPGGVSPTARCR